MCDLTSNMKPIDLYVVPPSPPCRAVIIAAKYMKIDVNLIYVDLMKGEQKQDWFVKLNPQHCLPTINDNGFILWESRAIMAYLANSYAPDNSIYPSDPAERAIVDRLLQFDLNVLYRSLGEYLIPIVREDKKLGNLNPVKERRVTEALSYLESTLEHHPYVAGKHLTLADFSIFYSMEFASELKYDFSKFKKVSTWFDRLRKETAAIDQYMNYTVVRNVCNPSPQTTSECSSETCATNGHVDEVGTCNLDKLCVESNNEKGGSCTKVISQENANCKVVTNYSTKQAVNQSSQNLFDLLKNTGGKMFDSPK